MNFMFNLFFLNTYDLVSDTTLNKNGFRWAERISHNIKYPEYYKPIVSLNIYVYIPSPDIKSWQSYYLNTHCPWKSNRMRQNFINKPYTYYYRSANMSKSIFTNKNTYPLNFKDYCKITKNIPPNYLYNSKQNINNIFINNNTTCNSNISNFVPQISKSKNIASFFAKPSYTPNRYPCRRKIQRQEPCPRQKSIKIKTYQDRKAYQEVESYQDRKSYKKRKKVQKRKTYQSRKKPKHITILCKQPTNCNVKTQNNPCLPISDLNITTCDQSLLTPQTYPCNSFPSYPNNTPILIPCTQPYPPINYPTVSKMEPTNRNVNTTTNSNKVIKESNIISFSS